MQFPIQLFDPDSSTFTYVLADLETREAIIIDAVAQHVERDLATLVRLNLKLKFALETHVHADHITSAGLLCERTGALAAVPAGCGVTGRAQLLYDGTVLDFGASGSVHVLHTPGHTPGSTSFLWRGNLFTGDTLLINGCGRTDFQGGSARDLYASIVGKLFSLPDSTLVWPGHDYSGRTVSTIGWEKLHNQRLAGRDSAAFTAIMDGLNLPRPKMIDVAVPANRNLGNTN